MRSWFQWWSDLYDCRNSITLTALAIAAIAGILLNIILPGNDYEFGVNPAGDENRGIHA